METSFKNCFFFCPSRRCVICRVAAGGGCGPGAGAGVGGGAPGRGGRTRSAGQGQRPARAVGQALRHIPRRVRTYAYVELSHIVFEYYLDRQFLIKFLFFPVFGTYFNLLDCAF